MAFFNKAFLLAGFLAIAPLSAFGQSLEEGIKFYQRGNYVTALEHLEPLAEQGNGIAQGLVGGMYVDGYGVSKNSQEAVFWFRLSAEQGDASGQALLGSMYESGEGVPQSYPEAFTWYRLAAEQGYSDAQLKVGNMYETGTGVPQNYGEAVSWYRLAAEQGSSIAQFNLSIMYFQGRGVSRNDVMVYMLVVLAAAQGHETAREVRDVILETLSREQIEEGQRFATEWRIGSPLPTFHDFSTWP